MTILPCSGCRQRKEIVAIFRQFKYCQSCVDKNRVPTSKQLADYFNGKNRVSHVPFSVRLKEKVG